MALTSSVVDEFVAVPKTVPASQRMAWRTRSESIMFSRVGVEARGATIGELVMIVSLAVARDWT